MQRRGFVYDETDPDLLVNFFSNVREVTDVRRSPQASFGYGYYGYRYGLYGAWPYYDDYVDTVRYKVGTANIDIVDGERMQLIWEGVAEGRITEAAMEIRASRSMPWWPNCSSSFQGSRRSPAASGRTQVRTPPRSEPACARGHMLLVGAARPRPGASPAFPVSRAYRRTTGPSRAVVCLAGPAPRAR